MITYIPPFSDLIPVAVIAGILTFGGFGMWEFYQAVRTQRYLLKKDQRQALSEWAAARLREAQVEIYYQRDDHVYVPLSLNAEEATRQVLQQFDAGWTHGSLRTQSLGVTFMNPLKGDRAEVEQLVGDWYASLLAILDHPEIATG